MLIITDVTRIYLGIQGENEARTIAINVHPWLIEYPSGSVSIWHKRNGDANPGPTGAVFDDEAETITWTPTSTDTYVDGEGDAEIRLTENGIIKKSKSIKTGVSPAVTGAGVPLGSDWQSYINEVERIKGLAVSAKEDAVSAAEDAEDAKDAAEDAQEAAEAARDAAQAAAGNFQGMTAEVEALDADDEPTIEVEHSEGGLYNFKFGTVPGTTFTPEVSEQGLLSWSNDGGKTNPESVNIKGPQGDPAPQATVEAAVEAWLEDNVDPETGYVLDRNLSSANAAAPADMVGKMPPVKDSTATGVDLDVSDLQGNVILRLADGHIQTKEFDSSEIAAEIETLSEDVENKIDEPETPGTAGQVLGLDSNLDPVWVDQTGGSSDTPVKNSTATGVDMDVSDPAGNVILRISNGHIQTKNFNSAETNSGNILTVKSSGGDYTSIRAAVEAAATAGASADNPYIIQIDPGTYNILSYYTSEEIGAEGFIGLMITDGITLEGMGVLREDVVLTAEMNTTTYDQTTRNHVSTLNIKGNSGLKNLTVKANNIRYAVHDDMSFTSSVPKIRKVENCKFFATNTTSGGDGNISYGAGTDGRKVFLFNDCDFGDIVTIHTNTSNYPNLVIMENCRGFAFTCTDYASGANNHYYLNNCVFNWIKEGKGSNWVAQHLFLHGNVLGAMVDGWDGMFYESGDTIQYLQYSALTAKKAVAMKNSGRYHLQYATGADDCIGIIYYYDSTNNIAYVQHGGWICAELLGFASPTVGQYLIVGSDGALSLGSSATDAIGRVVCENAIGSHFIKLSI